MVWNIMQKYVINWSLYLRRTKNWSEEKEGMVESEKREDCIVANCPGISGTVPDFLPVSRKGPENLL